jgi:hypothetical protein
MIAAVAFALLSLVLWIRLYRIKKHRVELERAPEVPQELREASHDFANQNMRLRSGLRKLSTASNPVEALVAALSSDNNRNGNNAV